ncbi:phosphatase PAP2 family protein [Sphingomonas flavalba]|uniref:phosphatase PAP2 family protein n=1 Tax=Sphingomonas flavalba TaxID=2559804 RepID=UPI0039DF715C
MLVSDVRVLRLAARAARPAERMAVIPGSWLAGGLALSALAVAAMIVANGQTVVFTPGSRILFWCTAIVGISVRWLYRQPLNERQRIARDAAESIGLFALLCLLGAVASYPVAAYSTGFHDGALERIDAMLRFDWRDWYGVVAAHRPLQRLGAAAYASIFFTPALLLGYFAWAGRQAEARRFIVAFWLAAVTTLLLFALFPAEGPLATLWHGPIPYMPASALYQSELIPELRSRALTVINLGDLRGLVCAPSFHTSSAVLYMAAAWPFPRLRWPVVAINVAMLLATPVEGTHYLADMLFGAAVALAALAVATALVRALPSAGHPA